MHHLMVVQTSSPKKTNKTNCWKSIDQSQPSYQLVQDFFHQHIHRPRNVMKGSKGLELRKYFKVWPCRQQRWQCKVCWGNRRKEGNIHRFCKKNKVVLVQNVRRNRQHIYIYCDTVSHLIVDSESKRLQSWFRTCNTLENTKKTPRFCQWGSTCIMTWGIIASHPWASMNPTPSDFKELNILRSSRSCWNLRDVCSFWVDFNTQRCKRKLMKLWHPQQVDG